MKAKSALKALLATMLCLSGSAVALAQNPGPGVDPDAVMMEDFENGDFGKWTARPGARGEKMTLELMDAQNGDEVRFGRYAMKVNINFLDAQAQQTLTAQISPGKVSADLQIPGNADGGKKLGFWCYATAGVQGMWMRLSTRPIGATSGVNNLDFASHIDWIGWKYVECKLPKGYELHPDAIRFLVLKSFENYFVNGYVIIDNIRVSNQAFAEDHTPPTISSFQANDAPFSETITTSKITFTSKFTDNGGSLLNYDRIQFVIDGEHYKADDSRVVIDKENNTATLSGLVFTNGAHTADMIVEDNFGNISKTSRTFNVDASDGTTTAITMEPAENPFVGVPYTLNINTNEPKNVKNLEFVLQLNNIGSVADADGVQFAASASGSSYAFDARTGNLTVTVNNDVTTATDATLAAVKVNISRNSYATDILRVTPVSAKVTYADGSASTFALFEAFEKPVLADYTYSVLKRVVGLPGEVKLTDNAGNPVEGATVYALSEDMTTTIASATTGANGVATGMSFTDVAQAVNIYAEKDGKFSYTSLVRTLNALLTATPEYIRAGSTPDPKTQKTLTWMANPVLSLGDAVIKIAKKADGEGAMVEHKGVTRLMEYNAVVSNGATKGNSVTVTGLEPATTYIYKVGDGTNWSNTQEFTTAGDTNKFSFAAFGDLQASSNEQMSRFIAAAKTLESQDQLPLFSLNVGDVIDSDDRYDCYSYYGYLANQCPTFAGIDMVSSYGNHEYMGNVDADNIKFINGHHTVAESPNYDERLVGTGTYFAEYGNLIILSLDWEHRGPESAATMMEETAKWMDEVLTAHADKTWKVVTLHYPIYPNPFTPGSQGTLAPIFDKHGVQMVFCGHGHTYERVQVKEGKYLVPTDDRRTFTPVRGGTIHMQLGDMTRTGAGGRWFHCKVDGETMRVDIHDAANNVVEAESFTLYANESVGVESVTEKAPQVYPNPVESYATVVGAEGAMLSVKSLTGATVMQQSIGSNSENIDVAGLAQGIYFFQIERDGAVTTVKVIKK